MRRVLDDCAGRRQGRADRSRLGPMSPLHLSTRCPRFHLLFLAVAATVRLPSRHVASAIRRQTGKCLACHYTVVLPLLPPLMSRVSIVHCTSTCSSPQKRNIMSACHQNHSTPYRLQHPSTVHKFGPHFFSLFSPSLLQAKPRQGVVPAPFLCPGGSLAARPAPQSHH